MNRRDFLRQAAGAAVSVIAAPVVGTAEECPPHSIFGVEYWIEQPAIIGAHDSRIRADGIADLVRASLVSLGRAQKADIIRYLEARNAPR